MTDRMNLIARMAERMDENEAFGFWQEFLMFCARRNYRHECDGRTSAAPLVPDVWAQPSMYAAGIRLGHIESPNVADLA
jgi:hypothetical protein